MLTNKGPTIRTLWQKGTAFWWLLAVDHLPDSGGCGKRFAYHLYLPISCRSLRIIPLGD